MYQETHFSANVWKALKNDEAFIGENDTSFNKKTFLEPLSAISVLKISFSLKAIKHTTMTAFMCKE